MGWTRRAWRRVAQPVGRKPLNSQHGGALTRTQATALLLGLTLTIGAVAMAAVLVSPNRARTFDLIHGSLFLADDRAPVAVDLATGKPTVRLLGANSQVDAVTASDLSVMPLSDGTLLLNSRTGEFNMVDSTGFVIKTTAGGVPLPRQARVRPCDRGGRRCGRLCGPGRQQRHLGVPGVGGHRAVSPHREGKDHPARFGSPELSRAQRRRGPRSPPAGTSGLLTGPGNGQTLRQLSVPAGSRTGAQLTVAVRAEVPGIAALAAVPDAGAVVLASAGQLQVFGAGARRVQVPGLSGVDQILPARNAGTTAAFLYHAGNGWNLVTARAGQQAASVRRLDAISPSALLAPPALSGGRLYSMDRSTSGALWQIGLDGQAQPVAGASQYPTSRDASGRPIEVADFGDAQVIAVGSRVLFNSPDHVLALAVFTDGSKPPSVVDKSSAADLNAAGGASAITAQHNSTIKKPSPQAAPPKAATPTAPAINNKLSCASTTQAPHVPTITTASSAARSVLLNWDYPLLDSEDCVPSTYVVTLRTLTDGSPAAPGQVSVQGQQPVNVTGLYPSTRYQVTVTAYLNGRGTASPAVIVMTGPEGPAAPTGVTATVDTTGDWAIAWHACGSVQTGCVPAATWTVIPQFCDGLGSVRRAGRPDRGRRSHQTQFATTLRRWYRAARTGLCPSRFRAPATAGNVGTTSAATACSYSLEPAGPGRDAPDRERAPADLARRHHQITVTLGPGQEPDRGGGGVGGQISFQLLAGGQCRADARARAPRPLRPSPGSAPEPAYTGHRDRGAAAAPGRGGERSGRYR